LEGRPPLTLNGVWSGDILLQRTAGIHVPDARGALTHSGLGTFAVGIGGPGGFTKSGPGAMFIAGFTGGNGYTGRTTITDGLLEATNMSRSLTGTEPGLVTYFRCDEGEGGALVELAPASPNINGTLTDGASFVFPGVVPFGDDDCRGGGACESCHVVSGRFDTNALRSVRALTITGQPSLCDPAKPCPGFEERPDAPVRHVLHHFTNATPDEPCVTAQLRVDCPATPPGVLGVAAYLGEFRLNQPCSSFLGDDGAFGPPSPPFSFRVPPLTNLILVVTARDTNFLCDTYMLELFGLPCAPPALSIAKDSAPDRSVVQWSSAYPDYRLQSVNALTGPTPPPAFADVATSPALVGGRFTVTTTTAPQFFRLAK
jgi:autotransporter-associated beta strand protein